jgi:hypothetical protein
LLLKFKGDTPDERIQEILADEGTSILRELQPKGLYLIKLKEEQDVKEAMKLFAAYEEVEYAEPNYILTIQ